MTPRRQRMLEDMRVRNLSPPTQRAYVENVARFARHFGRSPVDLGPEEIRTYQVSLVEERHLAPSSIEIAVCALRFLSTVTLRRPWSVDELIPAPKKPDRLPVVLSPDDVVRALACVASPKHRALLTTCYAAGLRISEAVHLRPHDIDSQRMVIRVEQGKGQSDRYRTIAADHGTGTGLSMVYRIVQLHDGDIEVESTPGRGTTSACCSSERTKCESTCLARLRQGTDQRGSVAPPR